jgi:CheY-like chemotaxis protein
LRFPADPHATASRNGVVPRYRAVVLDDDEMVRDVTAELLALLSFDTVKARSAAEAIDAVADAGADYDVLIADLSALSVGEATSLIEQLRVFAPGLGVVATSACPEQIAAQRRRARLSRHTFLQKPYTVTDLAAALRTLGWQPIERR